LVANRGEVAIRVFAAARSLGLGTVAVYTDVDARSRHATAADVAVRLGDGSTRGYLDIDAVLDAARVAGADAVHPGYGFLAEDTTFARAVLDAGLTWVGPAPEVIATMGDKLAAKAVAREVGVPLLASAAIEGDRPEAWLAAVEQAGLGWPVLVKAAAGGGGRGMREVTSPDDLAEAVASPRREAEAAFGDGRLYAERLVRGGRHVEVQLLGDAHGTLVHLGERECSVQRRHQKLIEEAPSPGITPAVRDRLTTAALTLGRHLGYQGAGTVEFLVDGDGDDATIAFLEVNTRLQVEHRVTELVTGLDLVALQLEVAAGRPLGFTQQDVAVRGHAIEVRLYSEDPTADFAPTFGHLHHLRVPGAPAGSIGLVDATVADGDRIGTDYDPLLAKVVQHHDRREVAAALLARRLRGAAIHGVVSNRDLLVAALEHPEFRAGNAFTDFLDHHPEVATAGPDDATVELHRLTAATVRAEHRRQRSRWPWAPAAWRNVPAGAPGTQPPPTGAPSPAVTVLARDGDRWEALVEHAGLTHPVSVHLDTDAGVAWVNSASGQTTWSEEDPLDVGGTHAGGAAADDQVVAPLPGTVAAVEVGAGDTVTAGQVLVVLEAMKMEHRLDATVDGTVAEVLVAAGDRVDAHQVLVRLTH
jgi:propionyl-CoA carboxylase alpha chain